ncbi:selenide, water dikinase SelD [Pelagovum sp. HNIBRBA483]|uniref:selenide, water dikinase SelD n=1 Tax=Pelagovum sp. HNIBRBA483 TaxID=3233341 RepID=UPI0034A3328E
MDASFPFTRDLVLIGGGHAHALFLRMWGMKPLAGVRVTVIDPAPAAAYSGMLPGFVAGHYQADELSIDLVRLCRFAGARYVAAAATGIDRHAKQVLVEGRPPIAYDVASIDVGIHSKMEVKGFAEHAVAVKPLWRFAEAWNRFTVTSNAGSRVVIIGGGIAGVELALAAKYALGDNAEVCIVDRAKLLSGFRKHTRDNLLEALRRAKISWREGIEVSTIEAGKVCFRNGQELPADMVLGAAGARPHAWLQETGLNLVDGFVVVDETLRASDESIFAVGDCAHLSFSPRPKAGVFAVRQGPVLFENLRAALSGNALRNYRPQKDYLKLISLGGKSALAEKFGRSLQGPFLWTLKDRIDRNFMRRLGELPKMQRPDLPIDRAEGLLEEYGNEQPCAGCGAKVAGSALASALSDIPINERTDVTVFAGDDAALVQMGDARQVLTTDHLSALVTDPVLMTRIAMVHALGDIWAMGATPQALLVSLTLPRMSVTLQERTMKEIMRIAQQDAHRFGATIAGGHSSLGADLVIGFSATGLLSRDPITREGAKVGDALILTKPIGSGVLMAAEMRGIARGADVVQAYEMMCQPQNVASQILSGANAMTDVTGFGLAGHLAGICASSGCGAKIWLENVPVLEGAEVLSQQGVRSTLFEVNRANAGAIFGASGARADLLFDPQTAGGLLAAVPAAEVGSCMKSLVEAGYTAAHIGEITSDAGAILVT